MTRSDLDRRNVTFLQAEGLEPLPASLALREVSKELRSYLWIIFDASIKRSKYPSTFKTLVAEPWFSILRDWHVYVLFNPVDEFKSSWNDVYMFMKSVIWDLDYANLFNFITYVLRHSRCPRDVREGIHLAFVKSRAAYRIIDDTIFPAATEAEAYAFQEAFANLAGTEFNGCRAHLAAAADYLSTGKFADSVRESIHAVESIARTIEPTASTLAPALTALSKTATVHPALAKGFANLYGFTNDQEGIRHALLEEGDAKVDEADAIYMLGACAAFISYLIRKIPKSMTC